MTRNNWIKTWLYDQQLDKEICQTSLSFLTSDKKMLHTIMTNDNILLIINWLSFFACRVFVGQRRQTTRRGFGTTTPLSTWSSGRNSASLRKSTNMTWTTTCPPLTCRLTAENVSDCFAPRRHSCIGNVTVLQQGNKCLSENKTVGGWSLKQMKREHATKRCW